MPMSRHLIAFALVLLLPACATTGAARTASPATASASTSPPAATPHDPQLHAAPPQAPALPSPVVVPLDAAKIGRASCRERVGQYVLITVVAVSLKKKNTEKSRYN